MVEKNIGREDIVVSTKVFFGGKRPRLPNTNFLSRKHIIEGLGNSLKRLKLSYVDIIFAHRFDHITPLEEICRGFDWVVRKGWAHYWGTSEWTA
jgi:aryl-alcohol dehydrogenase-like predicted oxidoreductase